jgi:hypothetical protein
MRHGRTPAAVLCAVAAALAGSSCWLLRTHEHLLLTVLLGWLFGLVE